MSIHMDSVDMHWGLGEHTLGNVGVLVPSVMVFGVDYPLWSHLQEAQWKGSSSL